jgi:hypothetical protein
MCVCMFVYYCKKCNKRFFSHSVFISTNIQSFRNELAFSENTIYNNFFDGRMHAMLHGPVSRGQQESF